VTKTANLFHQLLARILVWLRQVERRVLLRIALTLLPLLTLLILLF
jgi:hypothetical protein